MEKYIKVKFTEDELIYLTAEANQQNTRINRLIHDKAMDVDFYKRAPLSDAIFISRELSIVRELLNDVIKREIADGSGLYERDVISLEKLLKQIEEDTAKYLASVTKKKGG